MEITGVKRIRNCMNYLIGVGDSDVFYLGIKIDETIKSKLIELGFSDKQNNGESLCPKNTYGPVSKFNSLGGHLKRPDLPKQTTYYSYWSEWTLNGYYYNGIQFRSREIIHREIIPPPSFELTILEKDHNKYIVIDKLFNNSEEFYKEITHGINLLLEIFKSATVYKEDFSNFSTTTRQKLDWIVLPSGDRPWETSTPVIKEFIDSLSRKNQPVIVDRWSKIKEHKPDKEILGTKGYRGYIVFVFKEKNISIFESALYGNATYVFEGDWEDLSKLTKAEIINENLYKDRIIHTREWSTKINNLLQDPA